MKYENQKDDVNFSVMFSLCCKASLHCVRTVAESWELSQRGVLNLV